MMASSRGRNRSSPRDGSGFGRIGCLLHQAEEHAIMNRAETEDGSYTSARNRKLLAGLGLKPGENEYAEPALNPCQTTAYAFFTGDQLSQGQVLSSEGPPRQHAGSPRDRPQDPRRRLSHARQRRWISRDRRGLSRPNQPDPNRRQPEAPS